MKGRVMSSVEATRSARRRWPWVVLGLVAVVVIGGGATLWANVNRAATHDHGLMHVVEPRNLTITVSESGTIKARDVVTVRSRVEGRHSILSLIPEGTIVEEGDVLVELDASDLEERKLDQEMSVENAESNFIQAREGLEVMRNRAEAAIEQAELDYQFAKEDLEHYQDVEYRMELMQARNRVNLAQEEFEQARQRYQGSQALFEKRYISAAELQRDELAMQRAEVDHELAQEELRVLEERTKPRRVAELESHVNQMRLALERTEREAAADVLAAETTKRTRESELNRQKSRLERLERQIENATIRAPTAGMVVYSEQGRRWNPEPLVEGLEVRERQELMTLPTANEMNAEIRIHESARHKVEVGQRVRVRVDAVPHITFTGTVTNIGVMAEDGGVLNPDLREYKAEIEIDGEHDVLNPGMTANAEIRVAHYEDALAVPVQSVLRVDGRPTVYVIGDNGELQRREVEIGLDNNRLVHITEGLSPGEQVALAPPLHEGEREDFVPELDLDEEDTRTADVGETAEDARSERGSRAGRPARD